MKLTFISVLGILALVLVAFAQTEVTLLPTEGFEGAWIPAGWSQNPPYVGAEDWHSQFLTGFTIGALSAYVDYEVDNDDSLFTPVFDASGGYDSVIVDMWEDYELFGSSTGEAYILVSTDGGATWATAISYGRTELDVVHSRYHIESFTSSSATCKVCFWYDNNWDYHWALDDVTIYGYTPPSEPAPPSFSYTCADSVYPSGTTDVTVGVYINDFTGIDPLSAEICYSINGDPWVCDNLVYDSGLPDGTGDYHYDFTDLEGWSVIDYLFRATDTFIPANTGSSGTCSFEVLGGYYIYEDGTGYPMSPDPTWIDATSGIEMTTIEADDAVTGYFGFPFPFVLYGVGRDTTWLSSNGWILFDPTAPASSYLSPEFIPTPGGQLDNFIAWVWDDLVGSDGWAYLYLEPMGDYVLFSFENWRQYGGSAYFDCQVQIWNPTVIPTPGGNCAIDVRFNGLPEDPLDIEMGVENFDGSEGIAYLHEGGTYGDPSYLGLTSTTRTIRYCTVPPPSGTVYGHVTLSGRTDHSGAEVGLVGFPYNDISAIDGYYRISGIPAGTFDVYCTHPAFYAETVFAVVVVEDDSVEIDFTLDERPVAFITGTADLTDVPGPDAGIAVTELVSGVNDVTDATGAFFLDGVDAGDIQVVGTYPGYITAYTPVFSVAVGETVDIDTIFGPLLLDPLVPEWDSVDTDDGGALPTPLTGCWEWGTPTYGPPSAHTAPNCWGTVLDGDYDISANCKLDIALPYPCTRFAWYQWLITEYIYDGANVKVSRDGGLTWELATPLDTAYNAVADGANAGIPGEDCWSSGLRFDEWFMQRIDLTPDVSHIRFHFGSDGSITDAGWYVDDFMYYPAPTGAIEGYVYDCNTYDVIENAEVRTGGYVAYTDSTGYFFIPQVGYGDNTVMAVKLGYFPGYEDVVVFIDDTAMVLVPICPIDVDEIYGHLTYNEDDSVYFEICNPTDDTIWFNFTGVPVGGGSRARPMFVEEETFVDKGSVTPVDPNAYRAGIPSGVPGPSARPSAFGDVVDSFDVNAVCDMPWGLGLYDRLEITNFWVSNVEGISLMCNNQQFDVLTGLYTGLTVDVTGVGSSSWMGDMAWDANHRLMWQIAVGGSNFLYAFDVVTGDIVDSIGDFTLPWTAASQRGVGYDFSRDVFYVGGWNDNLIYEIKGKDWDVPGEVMNTYSAPNCAGIGFDPSRRTIWFAANEPADKIYEIEPATGTVINEIEAPGAGWLGGYALAGLEVDHNCRIWVTNMNTLKVYSIESPNCPLPGGIYVDPTTGFIAPGECVTFAIINHEYSTPVGDYCFDLYFYPGDNIPPYTIPTCVQVQPRAYAGWEIISVPLNATPNDPYIQLVDDIVPFNVTPSASNIYGYNQDTGLNELPTGFVRGKGYFLKTWLDRTYWDVYGTPFADGDFAYPVYYPVGSPNWGWWVVGNPFDMRVSWDAVYAATDFTYLDRYYWTWSEKDGFAFYDPLGGGGGADEYIDAWRGYYIYARDGNPAVYTDIIYPMDGALETFAAKAKPAPKVKTLNPAEFMLRVSAKGVQGSDVRTDIYNYIGVNETALDGFDDWDVREPNINLPVNTIDAYFETGGLRLMRDTKANFSSDSKVWTFKVRDIPAGMEVTLEWPKDRTPTGDDASCGVDNLDERWGLTLVDQATGTTIDMREDTSYTFTFGSGIRVFSVILTDEGVLGIKPRRPEEFALSMNKPNPFNATTEFTIALPEETDVKVEVFNILGRKVTTLVDESLDAGWHRIIWDARDGGGHELPSGIYLYKVVAGDFNETRKMTLVK
ncbi:hypothetical protein DRQ36_01075 [bacterium]|nr:MAG: hypothetical protein DRQ36_01075 [bacterium]